MADTEPLLDIVLFDIDDTLYSTTQFAREARRRAIEEMVQAGLRVDADAGYEELKEVVAEFSSNYSQHFARLLDRLGPEAYHDRNPAMLIATGVVAYHRAKGERMHIREDARAALEALTDAGVRLGVISAGLSVKQAEKLIRLGAVTFFDPTAIFFSEQMGVSKPNPKIFQNALDAIGVEPRRAMYVGDRPTHDVLPAQSIGMRTVHYTGAAGRHVDQPESAKADHVLDDLRELLTILRESYGLPV